MNIVVTVKQIPDPNVAPQLDGNRLKRDGVPRGRTRSLGL